VVCEPERIPPRRCVARTPSSAAVRNLRRFLAEELDDLSEAEIKAYYRECRRPSRTGKPWRVHARGSVRM